MSEHKVTEHQCGSHTRQINRTSPVNRSRSQILPAEGAVAEDFLSVTENV